MSTLRINKRNVAVFFLIGIIVLISYLWRKNRNHDIQVNLKYTFGIITKHLGSLKNGKQFYYEFTYDNKVYEWYRSTHVGYNVHVGDYYLVQFSYKNPSHSKILYEYQLKPEMKAYKDYVGDTIPKSIINFNKKSDKFW